MPITYGSRKARGDAVLGSYQPSQLPPHDQYEISGFMEKRFLLVLQFLRIHFL